MAVEMLSVGSRVWDYIVGQRCRLETVGCRFWELSPVRTTLFAGIKQYTEQNLSI